jgi:hypothetical protein
MIKVRPATPEEEAEYAGRDEELREASEAGEIQQGSAEDLASHILSGKEVVLSEQVREFLIEQGMTEDDFIAMLLKEGNRAQ